MFVTIDCGVDWKLFLKDNPRIYDWQAPICIKSVFIMNRIFSPSSGLRVRTSMTCTCVEADWVTDHSTTCMTRHHCVQFWPTGNHKPLDPMTYEHLVRGNGGYVYWSPVGQYWTQCQALAFNFNYHSAICIWRTINPNIIITLTNFLRESEMLVVWECERLAGLSQVVCHLIEI